MDSNFGVHCRTINFPILNLIVWVSLIHSVTIYYWFLIIWHKFMNIWSHITINLGESVIKSKFSRFLLKSPKIVSVKCSLHTKYIPPLDIIPISFEYSLKMIFWIKFHCSLEISPTTAPIFFNFESCEMNLWKIPFGMVMHH